MSDGGPAFPFTAKNLRDGYDEVYSGMSLRDYFAAKALQAIIGNQSALDELHKIVASEEQDDSIARVAYGFADAMLKARSI
jgi:hypothetical protein